MTKIPKCMCHQNKYKFSICLLLLVVSFSTRLNTREENSYFGAERLSEDKIENITKGKQTIVKKRRKKQTEIKKKRVGKTKRTPHTLPKTPEKKHSIIPKKNKPLTLPEKKIQPAIEKKKPSPNRLENLQDKKSGIDDPVSFSGFIKETLHGAQSLLHKDQRYRKELWSSYTRLRLETEYNDEDLIWKGKASGNVDVIASNYMESPEFIVYWKGRVRNRLFSLEKSIDDHKYLVRRDVHRLWASWSSDNLDLKFGRQTLSWGQGRLINPMDLVTPQGPFLLDSEDVSGADIFTALYSINSFDIIEVVVAPYKRVDNNNLSKLTRKDSNGLLRYKSTKDNLDFSAVTGYHFHSYLFGSEFTLTKWDTSFRASWLARDEGKLSDLPYYDDKNLPAQTTHLGTLGMSYAFWGKLKSNLEILFNSGYYANDPALESHIEKEKAVELGFENPNSRDSSYFRTAGRVITKNPYLIQFSVGYNWADVWNLNFVVISDPVGKSNFFSPSFSYDFSDEGVWVLGAQFANTYGVPAKAEFDGFPLTVYTYARLHF